MNSTVAPSVVRQLVVRALGDLLKQSFEPEEMVETILIRDGQYRGRSYRLAGWMALWLVESGLVQFFDAEGDLVRVAEVVNRSIAKAA